MEWIKKKKSTSVNSVSNRYFLFAENDGGAGTADVMFELNQYKECYFVSIQVVSHNFIFPIRAQRFPINIVQNICLKNYACI